MIICRIEGEKYEQQLCFKDDFYGRGGKNSKVFASLFHCWYNNHVAIFSLCLLDHAYYVEFKLLKKYSSLGMTLVFLVDIDEIVCSNIDSNEEVSRKQQQKRLGSKYG